MRLGSNSLTEMALDVVELAILIFAISWPGVYVTKLALRLSPSLYGYIQRRYGDKSTDNPNVEEHDNE